MTTATQSEELDSQAVDNLPSRSRRLSNLFVRFLTGMVVLPFLLVLIFLGGWFTTIPLGFLMLMGILEFYYMEKKRGLQNNGIIGVLAAVMVVLAFHYEQALLWQIAVVATIILTFIIEFGRGRVFKDSVQRIATTVGGIFYIAFPMSFLVAIRGSESGLHWFFAFVYCTWGTDTFAYLIGNMFGKTKLAPALSPGKTVEGAIGGIVAGALLPLAVLYQGQIPITLPVVLMFIAATFAATLADLFESGVKRFFGVKDSHIPSFDIIPGHGGVLDRIDSTLGSATVIYVYLVMTGHIAFLV